MGEVAGVVDADQQLERRSVRRQGRRGYEQEHDRRVAEGKTTQEALRALKRHLSNAIYCQLVADARTPTI